MPGNDYDAGAALELLMRKLRATDDTLAAEVQGALDSGRDETREEPTAGRRRQRRTYRMQVPFTPEEALGLATKALEAHFIQNPLCTNALLDEFSHAGVSSISPEEEAFTGAKAREAQPAALRGERKTVAIEVRTPIQLSDATNETDIQVLESTPNDSIEEQQRRMARLRELLGVGQR